ncbi:MAG: rod shape-determining protein MreD [Bacteroidales bacterium]|nr:rod shape-determining protein MreD [Bacteroidales bacterium]
MNSGYFKHIIRFIVLVLFQILILNNIKLNGYLNPYFYVLFILLLPFETPRWLLLLSAFLLGFSVDMFENTMGINIAACVLMAYLRPYVIRFVASKQDYEPGLEPCIRDLGFTWFISYSLILVFIHHFAMFYIEVFRFSEFLTTFYRVLGSTVFTMVLIIMSQYLFYRPRK